MSNQIAIPSYLDEGSLSPIRGTLEGAWRLRSLMEYKGAYRGWCTPEKESWGPRDYLFEPGFLTINALFRYLPSIPKIIVGFYNQKKMDETKPDSAEILM